VVVSHSVQNDPAIELHRSGIRELLILNLMRLKFPIAVASTLVCECVSDAIEHIALLVCSFPIVVYFMQ